MSEQERIAQMTANLGAVIQYRMDALNLQKSIRLALGTLEKIGSEDQEYIDALSALSALLPSRIEKADKYIEKHRAPVEAAVNKLLGEV